MITYHKTHPVVYMSQEKNGGDTATLQFLNSSGVIADFIRYNRKKQKVA